MEQQSNGMMSADWRHFLTDQSGKRVEIPAPKNWPGLEPVLLAPQATPIVVNPKLPRFEVPFIDPDKLTDWGKLVYGNWGPDMLNITEQEYVNAWNVIYDTPTPRPGGNSSVRWSHLAAKDLETLHTFAKKIGLKRAWFHNKPGMPHYDISSDHIRMLADMQGAGMVERKQLWTYIKHHYGS